jgi:predicted transcriptional regulator
VRQAIEAGVSDADGGRTVSHEDALARVRARIRRMQSGKLSAKSHDSMSLG